MQICILLRIIILKGLERIAARRNDHFCLYSLKCFYIGIHSLLQPLCLSASVQKVSTVCCVCQKSIRNSCRLADLIKGILHLHIQFSCVSKEYGNICFAFPDLLRFAKYILPGLCPVHNIGYSFRHGILLSA